MLSYQHGYHAGNFADVHKHTALCLLLRDLARQPQPFFFIDTHAGRGRYDLLGPQARKTGEWKGGIGKLWGEKAASDGLALYLSTVRATNGGGALRSYPGSPLIAARLARPIDEIVAAELHPAELTALKRALSAFAHVRIERRDGFEALAALTPPAAGRGLALVDPSYELKDDYSRVPAVVGRAAARWRDGIFMAWYPILPEGRHEDLLAGFSRLPVEGIPVAVAELHRPAQGRGLMGTGLAVVNPPPRFEAALAAAGTEMAAVLLAQAGRHEMRRLASA